MAYPAPHSAYPPSPFTSAPPIRHDALLSSTMSPFAPYPLTTVGSGGEAFYREAVAYRSPAMIQPWQSFMDPLAPAVQEVRPPPPPRQNYLPPGPSQPRPQQQQQQPPAAPLPPPGPRLPPSIRLVPSSTDPTGRRHTVLIMTAKDPREEFIQAAQATWEMEMVATPLRVSRRVSTARDMLRTYGLRERKAVLSALWLKYLQTADPSTGIDSGLFTPIQTPEDIGPALMADHTSGGLVWNMIRHTVFHRDAVLKVLSTTTRAVQIPHTPDQYGGTSMSAIRSEGGAVPPEIRDTRAAGELYAHDLLTSISPAGSHVSKKPLFVNPGFPVVVADPPLCVLRGGRTPLPETELHSTYTPPRHPLVDAHGVLTGLAEVETTVATAEMTRGRAWTDDSVTVSDLLNMASNAIRRTFPKCPAAASPEYPLAKKAHFHTMMKGITNSSRWYVMYEQGDNLMQKALPSAFFGNVRYFHPCRTELSMRVVSRCMTAAMYSRARHLDVTIFLPAVSIRRGVISMAYALLVTIKMDADNLRGLYRALEPVLVNHLLDAVDAMGVLECERDREREEEDRRRKAAAGRRALPVAVRGADGSGPSTSKMTMR